MATVVPQTTGTGSSTGTTLSITKPTSLAVGDGMIAFVANGDNATITSPAGWTQFSQDTSSVLKAALFWKLATSGDVAASTFDFTLSAGGHSQGAITRLGKNDATSFIDQFSKATGSSTSVSITGITPTKAMGTYLLFVASLQDVQSNNTVGSYAVANNNPSWTESYDQGTGFGTTFLGIAMGYGATSALSASGSATATIQRTANYVGYIINVVPSTLPTASITSTAFPRAGIRIVVAGPALLAATAIASTPSIIAPTLSNAAKSASSWTNTSKS